ncbi:MAG TPA: homoserine dehydrogenase, partial [Candidatus Competibacteraceae bacterium]|nr:homoserine dehydrogenase [Candidatus Competibacteraceae bacterium]
AEVTRILADRDISIEALVQKEPALGASDVPIILLTYEIQEKWMNEAIAAIEALDAISAPVTRIRLEHLGFD